MPRIIYAVVVLLLSVGVNADVRKPKDPNKDFYIYKDAGSRENNFIPSGWMGSPPDIRFSPTSPNGEKNTCIKIMYTAKGTEAMWAGIYFQSVPNNWGDKPISYDLRGYKKLSFKAKGEKGGEYIDKFGMGGIVGTESYDSDSASIENIELTKEWKTYVIDLKETNLESVVGGFLFAVNADYNQDGAIFYLDDIVYLK